MNTKNKNKSGTLIYPSAVAIWLVDNTSLTFNQIAQACGLHILEIQAMADGDIASGIVGFNPVTTSEITREEIERCEKDPNRIPQVTFISYKSFAKSNKKKAKSSYLPLARRRAKPDAIMWLLNKHPQLSVNCIVKLIGTTAKIVNSIKNASYWNIENIKPRDPVMLKLCSQEELDELILKVKISGESDEGYFSDIDTESGDLNADIDDLQLSKEEVK
ncbi:DUF1013 domain-containing protein [Anaplasmataceae bacterium AB001_6]|nr:DUF1013 domain-containing protein [Anaplasmataceae bacterium AB001_6]